MTLAVVKLERVFLYAGTRLVDIDPTMTPLEVRDLYAASGRPELSSAEIHGPELVGDEQHYSFHRSVGTKALELLEDSDLEAIPVSNELAKALAGFGIKHSSVQCEHSPVAAIITANRGDSSSCPPSELIPWLF
jgi:PRTRC genetic system protein C